MLPMADSQPIGPAPATPRLALTVTGGDGDGDRTGYWTLTGPQDPHDATAIIERAKSPDDGHVFYAWYLTQRTKPEFNAPNTYMLTIAHGFAAAFDTAVGDVTEAWWQLLGAR